jgi:putative oxidoreductase
VFSEIGLSELLFLAAVLVILYRIRAAIRGSGLAAWHERHDSTAAQHRWHRVLLLEGLELVLAGVFFLVGGAKLIGRPDMVRLFHDIGVGQWFRYVTGTIEVAGAVLLVAPLLSGASAVVLGAVMVIAALIELFILHRPPIAAIACLSGHTFVAWARVSGRHNSWRTAKIIPMGTRSWTRAPKRMRPPSENPSR